MKVVLSIFPGIDLFGKGFEAEGYCVTRGQDVISGGDIRAFNVPHGVFHGVIGGPPCPDFSKMRRTAPTGYGLAMIAEFVRVVSQAAPEWFLMENVPGVPTIEVPGYKIQRFNLNASECGLKQNRLRCFQFGSLTGKPLVIHRGERITGASPCCLASEGKVPRRSWADFCELQGLPREFELSGWSRLAKYRAVGNGVPVPMARVVATAIRAWTVTKEIQRVCVCDCGRPVQPGRTLATAACRKRMQRRRDMATVTEPGMVTPAESQLHLVTELETV